MIHCSLRPLGLNPLLTLCWRPAAEVSPSIDNRAKQLSRAVSIVFCGVGLRFIEIYASNPAGSR